MVFNQPQFLLALSVFGVLVVVVAAVIECFGEWVMLTVVGNLLVVLDRL